jgi:drug/metabolite transporter (DMT)-like permease
MNVVSSHTPVASFSLSRRILGHICLAVCLILGVSAQLLLKFATLQVSLASHAWLPYLWIFFGLGVYAAGTVCWMMCLGYLDLSYAYPFTGLTYVLVLWASWYLFGDDMPWQRIAGAGMVCLGVVLLPMRSQRAS